MSGRKPGLRVAMIGHGFMGAAHSQAWRVAPRFFDLGAPPEMSLLVGRSAEPLARAADTWGWGSTSTDWRDAVTRDDIDVVDIVTPGDSHAEIAIAALEAGKHVLCEKPLANSVADAQRMTAAARVADARGVRSMVGFSYRRVPAATLAHNLVTGGRIGVVNQVRASYRQDWLVDPSVPLSWRLRKERAGSGALGDIGAHAVDLAQWITGSPLVSVSGVLQTVVPERPLPASSAGAGNPGAAGLGGVTGEGTGTVTVDDVALFAARFDSGVLGSFEATRFATGRKNAFVLEISGTEGAIVFDLEDMNALLVYDRTSPAGEQGFTRIQVTEPEHPYMSSWWPTGHIIGYEHTFTHEIVDFVRAIGQGTSPSPSFAEGLQVQRVLDAVETSAASGSSWTAVEG